MKIHGMIEVRAHTNPSRTMHEIRVTVDGGGPAGMEVVFTASEDRTRVAVWNPVRHAWARVSVEDLESTLGG